MRKACYIFVIIAVISCTSNTIFKKPEDLIEKELMVDLLTDLTIATMAKNEKNIYGKRNVDYTQLVFEKYGIDTTRFKKSNFYYTSRIDDYQAIYLEVEKRIEGQSNRFKDLKKEKDSLKRDRIRKIKLKRDSIKREEITKDSMVLDALNKKIKDSTLRYDLKQLKFLRKTLHMDSLRSIVIGLDTVKEISKDSLSL
jgi:hypothetical protein